MQTYLIDANVFVQAKNMFYRFGFCLSFWNWIEDSHTQGVVFSVKKVREELIVAKPEDEVRKWCENLPKGFFLEDKSSAAVMANYAKLMAWANKQPQYTQGAKNEFALDSNADPFLIARAMYDGSIVVTHEERADEAKKKVPLPNAAAAFGVQTMTVYDLLSAHAVPSFVFQIPGLDGVTA
jgi:hypothetical protein